jgi:hypothetical protein
MDLDGCSKSVKKEIVAIHDQYLDNKDRSREFRIRKKRKVNIIQHLFSLIKS